MYLFDLDHLRKWFPSPLLKMCCIPIRIDLILLYFHIHALILLKAKAHVVYATDS